MLVIYEQWQQLLKSETEISAKFIKTFKKWLKQLKSVVLCSDKTDNLILNFGKCCE